MSCDIQNLSSEVNAALLNEVLVYKKAVVLLDAFLTDLERSNPGYLGKLCLQNYQQFNEAMIARSAAIQLFDGQPKKKGKAKA